MTAFRNCAAPGGTLKTALIRAKSRDDGQRQERKRQQQSNPRRRQRFNASALNRSELAANSLCVMVHFGRRAPACSRGKWLGFLFLFLFGVFEFLHEFLFVLVEIFQARLAAQLNFAAFMDEAVGLHARIGPDFFIAPEIT